MATKPVRSSQILVATVKYCFPVGKNLGKEKLPDLHDSRKKLWWRRMHLWRAVSSLSMPTLVNSLNSLRISTAWTPPWIRKFKCITTKSFKSSTGILRPSPWYNGKTLERSRIHDSSAIWSRSKSLPPFFSSNADKLLWMPPGLLGWNEYIDPCSDTSLELEELEDSTVLPWTFFLAGKKGGNTVYV